MSQHRLHIARCGEFHCRFVGRLTNRPGQRPIISQTQKNLCCMLAVGIGPGTFRAVILFLRIIDFDEPTSYQK